MNTHNKRFFYDKKVKFLKKSLNICFLGPLEDFLRNLKLKRISHGKEVIPSKHTTS